MRSVWVVAKDFADNRDRFGTGVAIEPRQRSVVSDPRGRRVATSAQELLDQRIDLVDRGAFGGTALDLGA